MPKPLPPPCFLLPDEEPHREEYRRLPHPREPEKYLAFLKLVHLHPAQHTLNALWELNGKKGNYATWERWSQYARVRRALHLVWTHAEKPPVLAPGPRFHSHLEGWIRALAWDEEESAL